VYSTDKYKYVFGWMAEYVQYMYLSEEYLRMYRYLSMDLSMYSSVNQNIQMASTMASIGLSTGLPSKS
jgi:hypothetical protein